MITLPETRKNTYKAIPFVPYYPVPPHKIYMNNVLLQQSRSSKQLFTEDKKDIFEDDMVVEFRWDKNAKKLAVGTY